MKRRSSRSAALTSGILGVLLLAAPVHARGGLEALGERLSEAVALELGLTQQATALERAVVALEREHAGAEHAAGVLDHGGRQTLQQLDAYREGLEAREQRARRRARAMVKVARGGIARIAFEELGDEHSTTDRLARGRDLRWLVRRDVRELAAYQRAEQRARGELLEAERQLQALSVLATMHDMQGELLDTASRATTAALARATSARHELTRRAPIDAAQRARLRELAASHDELAAVRREGVSESLQVRPVRGRVVGAFGAYTDPMLRLPMLRNGVELEARLDEPVRAPAAGRVVMVAELPEFEQVVVIDHGGQQLSMLGRLWKVTASEGDSVKAGEVLGHVAPKAIEDGLGTTAYLELRHGDKPVDPAQHLGRAARR